MASENAAPEVVIIGAGLSGLACARVLRRAGLKVSIYEASDGVGGRVRTDEVEGFRLDRGFQVMLPSYPEARRVLHYDDLKLMPFYKQHNHHNCHHPTSEYTKYNLRRLVP